MSASERGNTLLAALVLVGMLGIVAAGFDGLAQANRASQTASTACFEDGGSKDGTCMSVKKECENGSAHKISSSEKNLEVSAQDDVLKCWEAVGNPLIAQRGQLTEYKGKFYKKVSNDARCGNLQPDKCRIHVCLDKSMLKDPNGNQCQLMGDFDPDQASKILNCEKLDKNCIAAMSSGGINAKPLTDLLGAADPKKIDLGALPNSGVGNAFEEGKAPDGTGTTKNPDTSGFQTGSGKEKDNALTEDYCQKNPALCQQGRLNPPTPMEEAWPLCTVGGRTVECDNKTTPTEIYPDPTDKAQEEAARAAGYTDCFEDKDKHTTCMKPAADGNGGNGQKPPGDGTTFNDGNRTNNQSQSGSGSIGSLLSNFLKGFMQGSQQQAQAQTCSTDPNVYAQQQQQYQQQLQQYNYQLQQYNYQQQYSSGYQVVSTDPVIVVPANSGNSASPPVRPVPCTPSTAQQCGSQPAQPAASSCNAGTWKPTYSGSCITGWQCVASAAPVAKISCQPSVADVGMTLAISYSCSSGIATSSSFTIATSSSSGTATTTIQRPPAGANTATYTLTCNDSGITGGAQCNVQVAVPSIILVANPKSVSSGGTSLIGWLTTGMDSCIVSSPNDSDFTTRNSSNTSTSGTATTSSITATTNYLLHCETLGGGVREATTTVSVL